MTRSPAPRRRSFRSRLFIGAAGAAALVLPLGTATFAAASTTDPNAQTTVAGGVTAAALPHGVGFGSTPPNTPETVSIVLKEKNLTQLEWNVTHGVKHFLTVSQFAKQYGESPAFIASLRSYLTKFGISSHVLADNVDVVANGTAGQFDKLFSCIQKQYQVPSVAATATSSAVPAQTVHANTHAPKLPYYLASHIVAVLGLTNYSPFVTNVAHVDRSTATPKATSPDSCIALTGLASDCNLPSDFSSRYGLSALQAHGATGAGQTVGIVTLAAYDPGSAEYFWKHIAKVPASNRSVSVVNIDGGPGAPSDADGTGETDLDVQQAGGIAYGANVKVYQSPNTDSGFADGFFQAASDNVAGSVSTSWGESETVVKALTAAGEASPGYVAAYDEAFLELAAQGQSTFAAAGDAAAYDDSDELGTTGLDVDVSADSPYVTAAGGTTLPFSFDLTNEDGSTAATVSVGDERAWGWDYLWAPVSKAAGVPIADVAESLVVGGGGGFSSIEPTPSYQQGVPGTHQFSAVKYLTPTDYQDIGSGYIAPTAWSFNPTPSVTRGVGTGRAVPDVSADADPYTGYLEYEPSAVAAGYPAVESYGGTSFVAPQFNGASAVLASALGHRVGFWNPQIYPLATTSHSPFTTLNSSGTNNDNLYYTGTPGLPFNEATGLGIPNFTKLAIALRH